MSFITTLAPEAASGDVAEMYRRQQQSWGFVPNYAKVFCHRPQLMARWAALLAEVKRPLDKRRLEMVTFAAAHELDGELQLRAEDVEQAIHIHFGADTAEQNDFCFRAKLAPNALCAPFERFAIAQVFVINVDVREFFEFGQCDPLIDVQ